MHLFAVDHNFPEPLVVQFSRELADLGVKLVPVRQINARWMEAHDDWELFHGLHTHADPWVGLISNDADMLLREREMCFLHHTRLTLVVIRASGHNPVRAFGVLLAHIQHVCNDTTPRKPQVWQLSVTKKPPDGTHGLLEKIASRKNVSVADLIARNPLPDDLSLPVGLDES